MYTNYKRKLILTEISQYTCVTARTYQCDQERFAYEIDLVYINIFQPETYYS